MTVLLAKKITCLSLNIYRESFRTIFCYHLSPFFRRKQTHNLPFMKTKDIIASFYIGLYLFIRNRKISRNGSDASNGRHQKTTVIAEGFLSQDFQWSERLSFAILNYEYKASWEQKMNHYILTVIFFSTSFPGSLSPLKEVKTESSRGSSNNWTKT